MDHRMGAFHRNAPWVITGAMDGLAFETYVKTQLAPALEPGTVVILDNLSTHKSPRAAQVLKDKGKSCTKIEEFVYLHDDTIRGWYKAI